MHKWTCKCIVEGVQNEATVCAEKNVLALRHAIQKAFGNHIKSSDFVITDFSKDITSDSDLVSLEPHDTLWIITADESLPVAKERIAFPPHPKTLTRAGDYEYFAAQGRTPFPYALAELIDNSLRATMRGRESQREIVISFVLSSVSNPSKGLISIWDNGSGMTSRALNNWAVMNLSMEDRGEKPVEEPVIRGDKSGSGGATRFLTGNLSYFGVGSKNAAFYLGKCIKVATCCANSSYVHELSIAASDLEQRYKEGKAVYEEDLIHRRPGQGETLPFEAAFPAASQWIQEEACCNAKEDASSFTRIVIGDLKPEILQNIEKGAGREQLCKNLAHLYHYYLHGEQGNVHDGEQTDREELPKIRLECIAGKVPLWQCNLADVSDDLESLYLQAQQSHFKFSLDIAGKGQVEGVLWYFPFQNETESLPVEDFNMVYNPIRTYNMTQQPAHLTQLPTQAGQGTQFPQKESVNDEEVEIPLWQRSKAPLFEAFWQGRLIPGARIDSLPFIEAVRMKRGAAAKDTIPDESFLRLRGALFFGPGFLVTRNKLTFRDNLQELLGTAVPKERHQEKHFKEWLALCHNDLDKVIRFERIAAKEVQAEAQRLLGREASAFECISEGGKVVERGDIIRLAVKPALLGKVLFFSVPQDVDEEGAYANGHVTIQPLPEAVFGQHSRKTLSLRRIEGKVTEEEQEDHCSKELLKVPQSIQLLSGSFDPTQEAGFEMPGTTVCVFNGSGQKVVKGYLAGEKQSYSLCQRLWFCPTGVRQAEEQAIEASKPPPKVSKKGKKRGKQSALVTISEPSSSPAPDAELISDVINSNPAKDCFIFPAISDCLNKAGKYVLEYTLQLPAHTKAGISCTTELDILPGPAVELLVQGEGRAAMATADLMLGEWLPDLTLHFQDKFGNATSKGVNFDDTPAIQIHTAEQKEEQLEYSIVPDLDSYFLQEMAEDGLSIVLSSMQIFGHKAYQPGSGPLSIFATQTVNEGAAESSQDGVGGESSRQREVHVSFSWPAFDSVIIPLRLLPGLPRSLQLLPGHPFNIAQDEQAMDVEGGEQMPTLNTASGSVIPGFAIQALDQWENPTQPCPEMPFDLSIVSDKLEPEESTIHFDPIATVKDLKAGHVAKDGEKAGRMVCRLVFPGVSEEACREVLGGADLPRLDLRISLEPSTAPAALSLLWNSQDMPIEVSNDGEAVAKISGVQAGSVLSDLSILCVDETGRPAQAGTSGKVQVSWTRGTKKVKLDETALPIPDLQVPERVTEGSSAAWVRFSTPGRSILELGLQIQVVAAEPHSWTAEAVDGGPETQGMDANGHIQCGQFFRIEISAVDAFNNRCIGRISNSVPNPGIYPEAASGGAELAYDPAEWDQGWKEREDGLEVFAVKLRVKGNPGSIHLHVRDEEGEEGSSKLAADCLDVLLDAGPPTCLMFDAPNILECGMRSTLNELRVKATDDFGNQTSANFEVALLPSAVSVDGSGQSAAVTAQGGNKASIKKGKAIFKDISLSAETPGAYVLRAKPTSRQIAGEASVTVQMVPMNAVTNLVLTAPHGKSLVSGDPVRVALETETEDARPLPKKAASEGLVVKMMHSEGSKPSFDLRLADHSNATQHSYTFESESIKEAGSYMVTAEYTEARPALAPSRRSRQSAIQAVALELDVCAGPPTSLSLQSAQPGTRLTVTNGTSLQDRSLLKAVALQLQDEFGNDATIDNVNISVNLRWPCGSTCDDILPTLEMAERQDQDTDCQGRAYFGDLYIAEGSGRRQTSTASEDSMEFELCFAAELPQGGTCEWSCQVLFSDDSQRYAALRETNERHRQLVERQQEIQGRLHSARERSRAMSVESAAANQAVENCKDQVLERPDTLAAAERALAAHQQRQDSSEANVGVEARYGASEQPQTKALARCLQTEAEGVVGVFAHLATVDEPCLARVLAAHYRSMITVLVVENTQCRSALEKYCAKHRIHLPDIMCMTHILKYDKPGNAEVAGWRTASKQAVRLQNAACEGTDSPLSVPLPHMRAINQSRREIPGLTLGPNEWPEGCLGYAYNLVRPTLQGHRATLLYQILGQTLVFDTLDKAQEYREYCTQVLKTGMADIVTLDMRRITGRGIISGASFRVPALEDSLYRFGSTPANKLPEMTQAQHQVTVLEQLIELYRARDGAEEALHKAQQDEDDLSNETEGQLQDLEREIAALNSRLGSQAPGKLNSASKRGRQSSKHNHGSKENRDPELVEVHAKDKEGAKGKQKKRRLTKMQAA